MAYNKKYYKPKYKKPSKYDEFEDMLEEVTEQDIYYRDLYSTDMNEELKMLEELFEIAD